MVRNTRTSIALKNASAATEEETPPPPPTTSTSQEAGDDEEVGERGSPRELMASGNEIDLPASLAASLSPSVLLQKLPVEPGGRSSTGGGSARKGPRKKTQAAAPARATRSRGKSSPVDDVEKEDSSDAGMVEVIEILDDESQSGKSVEIVSVNLEDELPCSLIVKGPGHSKTDSTSKKGECIVEAMDCDIDDTITIVDSKEELAEENTFYVVVDKTDSVELVQPSTSSKKPEGDPPVGQDDKPEPPTRKSKRQVKVTNKYRDFVVDAPLPSSQVPYSDIKLARGNGGGRKSHVKEVERASICDDSSIGDQDSVSVVDDLGPDSPTLTIRPPIRTYSSGKKDKSATKYRRKSIKSGPKEVRARKKADLSEQLEADETIELPGPDDMSDSTLTLHFDSSHFTDDEVIKYASPSPTEFYGWPDDEFDAAAAGPSTSTLSTISGFASDPCIFAELPAQLDEPMAEVVEPQVIKPVPKRRGRPPKSEQASPAIPIAEEPARPAGSTFIKRSYKTTKASPVAPTPVTTVPPTEAATPVKTPTDLKPEVEQPEEPQLPLTPAIAEDVDTAVKIVEPTDVVVLQADEIINIPRRRRRIRGGRRPTPADGPPRRGRSRPDSSLDLDEDSPEESKSAETIGIEPVEETPTKVVFPEVMPEEPAIVPEEPKIDTVVVQPPEEEVTAEIKKPEEPTAPSPKKTKPKSDSKRDSSAENRPHGSKSSKQRSRSTSVAERPKKEPEPAKPPAEISPKSPEDVIILDSKEIILPEEAPADATPTAPKEEKKVSKEDEIKTPKKTEKSQKESHRDSSSKSHKKSKESRERSKDSARKDRDHSKPSSKDREKDKKRSSDGGKREKAPEEKKAESRKSTAEVDRKPTEKKPAEPEKKPEKPATPIPEKPKLPEKPKKCFDMELQALEPIKKHRSADDSKRSKEKSLDKQRQRVEKKVEVPKKKPTELKQSKEAKPEKSRSTDTSPVPSKHHGSSASSKKDASTQHRKRRKSVAGALIEDKVKDESKLLEGVAPLDADKHEVKEEKLAEGEVKQEPEHPDAPRVATKASRKMYQNVEELQIVASSIESVPSENKVKPEVKPEDVQQIADEFDSSVQISGPRPEVALKAFENITLAEVEPKQEEESVPPAQTISPPSQELSNEDSNSNSTMDSLKEQQKVDLDDSSIRRSSRIKTISSQKQRTSGHGLVKDRDRFLKKTTISVGIESKVLKDALTGNFNVVSTGDGEGEGDVNVTNIELSDEYLRDMEEKLSRFETIRENMYHCDKVISKEAKKMMCDCFLTEEEKDRGELGCGEDCLNKLLMIECGSRCVVGERCTNKRFQKLEYANTQVFRTEKKGFGIQASTEIAPGEFIMEYVGEVLNSEQFDERAELYSKEKNKHYYFMALRSDAIIDATTKGNISRFINHSCDANAETQKWTVNGELRIGFFSTKYILPGEEVTFDYQFQRYGRKAQKCYCEADNCTGWIGGDPGSDGESEYEEEDVEESEEEAETVTPAIPVTVPEEPAKVDVEMAEVASGDVDDEAKKPTVEGEPEKQPIADIPTADDKLVKPKPKKVRKRIERPIKRRLQIHDPDLEKEINNLLKTGLKNQAQTLKLCRLMVRAKDIKSRSRLLTLLQSGELPCRRLFLDYHGLRLLYGWICESTESIEDLKFRIQILDTLDHLPIPNKTMLKDSKILQTIEKWAKIEKIKEKEKEKPVEKEKETSSTSSPSDSNGGGSDSNTSSDKKQEVVGSAEVLKNMPELLKLADLGKLKEIISSACTEKDAEKEKPTAEVIPSAVALMDSIAIPEPEDENAPEEKRLGTQIRILCCKLLISWINLKEVFRIPKKERIEQMKEHEREADLRYKALGLGDDEDASQRQHSSSRFLQDRSVDRSRELKRRKSMDDRELLNFHKRNRSLSTAIAMPKMDNLSKQQRRHLFEMKVAHEEAERRNKELWMQHENNCMKFGLNPHMTAPHDVPAKMNPATGEYFSADDRLLPTPPSHMYFKVLPPPMPTNPDDYELPPMDLPPLWKFAIDERGRLYYYHVKLRVPQWEPPKKANPNRTGQGLRDEDISMSSDSSTTDTEDSEEEYLNVQLEGLLKKKKKQQSCFNLDDVLAKPDDMNDDLSKTIKNLEAGDSSPQASSSGEKLLSESLEKTAEELMQHRKRKHSNKLVQERVISPRTEEDKLYGQMEMKRYKETKEKLRRRKEEAKRMRARSMLDKSLDSPFSSSFASTSASAAEVDDTDLMVSHKIVEDKCIVDELDVLTKKKKISPYEEWQKVKQRLGKKRAAKLAEAGGGGSDGSGASSSFRSSPSGGAGSSSSSKVGKRKKLDLNSEEAKKIKEKFRGEIAGVIVQNLGAYRKDTCQNGRITNTEDFKHLARKLTHFVLLKELKHCDNTINELTVSDSVRTKAREFIKKYMAKHGSVYVRGENEPDYANINL
uniref:[histone H3]-lysine(36) N-trimethyltransferase n=1 Tax=Culex pipiens TaxID=7175 RepID=A0A8D8P4B3_CULPI